ncbi:MAG: phytoene desaturase family protein [Pseudomonadota bacterium]|jgi:phytoene desaturase
MKPVKPYLSFDPSTAAAAGPARTGGAPHAIVIGSGFGGLAAAVRLGARGWRVTVLERLDGPGGRGYTHFRDGFTFDAGPTIVTAPFLFDELWALCGKRREDDVELRALDPFYRVRFADGSWFDYSGDPAKMRAEVARLSPGDVDGYERFMEVAQRCYELGFEGMAAMPFESVGDLLRAVPSMVRMRAWRSIHAVASKYIRDPRLQIVFSFHPLLIGGNPFSVTCAYSLIQPLERLHGVHWAMGGTGALARGLVKLIEGQGSTIRYHATVERIVVEAGRARGVVLEGGERLDADIVVSNADAAWTYRNLVAPEHRRTWTNAKIERSHYSMSLFVWYFGTKRRWEDVPHHMLVLGPRYKALLSDIFSRKVLAEDFSLYLHRPSATDPSVAPAGHDAFYVLSPVPHLDSGTDWAARGDAYRDAIAQALEATVLPGLRDEIVTSFYTTPQDFHDRLLSFKGAAFGFEPRLTQSAWFRPHNRSEDVEGLFMVGAGNHPGAGIPGVLSSAKALEKVLPDVSAFVR